MLTIHQELVEYPLIMSEYQAPHPQPASRSNKLPLAASEKEEEQDGNDSGAPLPDFSPPARKFLITEREMSLGLVRSNTGVSYKQVT